MYECFNCGERAVIWDNDFDFEDFCEEGEGIIHVLHCTNCGAEIEYRIRFTDEDDVEEEEDKRIESDSGEWQDGTIPPSVFHHLLLERLKGEDEEENEDQSL